MLQKWSQVLPEAYGFGKTVCAIGKKSTESGVTFGKFFYEANIGVRNRSDFDWNSNQLPATIR